LNDDLTIDHTIYQFTRGLRTEQSSPSHHKPCRILFTMRECCLVSSFTDYVQNISPVFIGFVLALEDVNSPNK